MLGYYYNPYLNVFDYMLVISGAIIISSSTPLVWNKDSLNVRKEIRASFLFW